MKQLHPKTGAAVKYFDSVIKILAAEEKKRFSPE